MALNIDVGDVVERYVYDPYGQVTIYDGSWPGSVLSSSAYNWKYLFQGGRYDTITNLYSFRHRDYDPVMGRWIEQDPAGYVDGASLYLAFGDNPVNRIDPLGLDAGGYAVGPGRSGGSTVSSGLGGMSVGMPNEGQGGQTYTPGTVYDQLNAPTTRPSGHGNGGGGNGNFGGGGDFGGGSCGNPNSPRNLFGILAIFEGPSGDDLIPTGDDIINEFLQGSGQYIDENGIIHDLGGDLVRDALDGTGQTLGSDNLIKPIASAPGAGMQVASGVVLLGGAALAIEGTANALDTESMMNMEYIRAMAQFHSPNPLWLKAQQNQQVKCKN